MTCMTFKKESDALDDKYITRPTSTIIVDDNDDNEIAATTTSTAAEAIDITKSVPEEEKHLVKEAGLGGAILGFLVCGPLGSLLLGFGSAYAIRKPKDSTIGKSSRWLAELTLYIKGKVLNEEEKHHFVKRSKTTIDKFCGDNNNDDKGNEKDDNDHDHDNDNTKKNKNASRNSSSSNSNNNIAFKTREFLVSGWEAASNYTKENQLFERGVKETGKGIEYVSRQWDHRNNNKKKASSSSDNNNNDDDDDTTIDDDEHTKLVTTATTN